MSRPVAEVRLSDGSVVALRTVHPDDKPLFLQGFHRLSPRSRYLRFLTPADRLTPQQLAYFSELDFRDHVAWGVIDGDDAVAVGRFVRLADDPVGADVAITVLDSHQRRGLGRLLIQTLATSARARGVGMFHFDVLAENRPMVALLGSLGALRVSGEDVLHLVLPVGSIPPPMAVRGDLGHLLEEARRRALPVPRRHQSGSSSSDAELTQ